MHTIMPGQQPRTRGGGPDGELRTCAGSPIPSKPPARVRRLDSSTRAGPIPPKEAP